MLFNESSSNQANRIKRYGDTCELYNHCWINKCLNNGICIQTEDYFKCECNNGNNGTFCQNCKYILIYFSCNLLLIMNNN